VDIKRLSTDLGVKPIEDTSYHKLKNLKLLEIPGIRRRLTERERMLGTTEEKVENWVQITANAIKCRIYSRSHYPYAKKLGRELRRIAVNELFLENYRDHEMAIILGVSRKTIRRDIRDSKEISKKEWWYQVFNLEKKGFLITKDWEF